MNFATKSTSLLAVSAVLSFVQPTTTFAIPVPPNTTITFNDTTDTVSVTVNQSGAGAPGTSGLSCAGEACTINILSPNPGNLDTGLTAPNGDPVNILEPGSSIISDILSSSAYEPTGLSVGDFTVTFTSDTDEATGLGLYTLATPGGTIIENGTVQDGFTFIWEDPTNGFATAATATIQFQSDLDSSGPTGVPEPASLALFGAGLFGLTFLRRKRRNRSERAC